MFPPVSDWLNLTFSGSSRFERLEVGVPIFFQDVYFSRRLSLEKGERRALLGDLVKPEGLLTSVDFSLQKVICLPEKWKLQNGAEGVSKPPFTNTSLEKKTSIFPAITASR